MRKLFKIMNQIPNHNLKRCKRSNKKELGDLRLNCKGFVKWVCNSVLFRQGLISKHSLQ